MTKYNLFKISSISLIVGFLLFGFGVGQIFSKGFIGLIIGTGIGFISFSLIVFRIIKRMDIYNKIEI